MDEYGYGSSGVWNIFQQSLLSDVVFSLVKYDYLQVELCAVVNFCSDVMDWSLYQVEDL